MKKLLRNIKGFTLAELMIVIAVIGILMIVLMPKVGQMKDNAKITGVESNMRSVASQLEIMIDDYNDPAILQNDLINRLGSNIKNPFNSSTDVTVWNENAVAGVKIYVDNNPSPSANVANDMDLQFGYGSGTKQYCSGIVCVAIYRNVDGTLEASIYGYKKNNENSLNGDPITNSNTVIRVKQ